MSKRYRVILEFDQLDEAERFFQRANQRPELIGAYPAKISIEYLEVVKDYTPVNLAALLPKTVFMSYRRTDSFDITHRIYDYLSTAFGNQLFMDIEKISLGRDFKAVLEEKLSLCDMMLVVIGPKWDDEDNLARLHKVDDFVRMEVEAALERNIPVIPLLVLQRTTLPDVNRLPEPLKSLPMRNGMPIRQGRDFDNDIRQLIFSIARG